MAHGKVKINRKCFFEVVIVVCLPEESGEICSMDTHILSREFDERMQHMSNNKNIIVFSCHSC
jgi:hypothetical protein